MSKYASNESKRRREFESLTIKPLTGVRNLMNVKKSESYDRENCNYTPETKQNATTT
jgi:hypothetical protein